MRDFWRRLRLRFDDYRGVCRLCQQGTIARTPRMEHVWPYKSASLDGSYHLNCALAVIETRLATQARVTS